MCRLTPKYNNFTCIVACITYILARTTEILWKGCKRQSPIPSLEVFKVYVSEVHNKFRPNPKGGKLKLEYNANLTVSGLHPKLFAITSVNFYANFIFKHLVKMISSMPSPFILVAVFHKATGKLETHVTTFLGR